MAPMVEDSPMGSNDSVGRLVARDAASVDENLTLRSIASALAAAGIGAGRRERVDRGCVEAISFGLWPTEQMPTQSVPPM